MKSIVMAVGFIFSLAACAGGPGRSPPPKLPYDTWYVGLAAPRHMEVWVESVDVIDQRGYAFYRVAAGVAGYTRKPEGWHKGGGKTMPVSNVDLPLNIFLRWQSLAEQTTYMINVPIPQWVRDEMVKPKTAYCLGARTWKEEYESAITLGMAPGGVVKVWMGGACRGYREVARHMAKIDPRGPHKDNSHKYYRAPNPEAQAYIDEYGIPYGTW